VVLVPPSPKSQDQEVGPPVVRSVTKTGSGAMPTEGCAYEVGHRRLTGLDVRRPGLRILSIGGGDRQGYRVAPGRG